MTIIHNQVVMISIHMKASVWDPVFLVIYTHQSNSRAPRCTCCTNQDQTIFAQLLLHVVYRHRNCTNDKYPLKQPTAVVPGDSIDDRD